MKNLLTRRESLAALGTITAGGLLAACGGDDEPTATVTTSTGGTTSVPAKSSDVSPVLFDEGQSCKVTPELTEGPYYIDVDKVRSDIREDRKGTRMRLAFRVRDAESCEPIPNAVVEVWHCDGLGSYSGVSGDDERYLRGAQVTNNEGIVQFTTVYPGWYQGRTVHFHIRIAPSNAAVVTTQVFTTREFDDKVYASAPYGQRPDRDVFNDSDGIFDESLVLTLREDGDGALGFTTFDVSAA